MRLEDIKTPFLALSPSERLDLVRAMRERRLSGGEIKANKLVQEMIKGKSPEEIEELLKLLGE